MKGLTLIAGDDKWQLHKERLGEKGLVNSGF